MKMKAVLLFVIFCGFGMAACGSDGGEDSVELRIVEYAELSGWLGGGEDMVIIDVRPAADFEAGHLQNAINIDLADLMGTDGKLLNEGKALIDVVKDKDTLLVLYCFGYGNDKDFGELAVDLGYSNVYRYAGGTQDWAVNGDYLVIEYSAFKAWHDAKFPFDDGENYLIDDLPVGWYSGDDPAHPEGHIPGAVNVPVELFADAEGNPVDEGKALTDIAPNKDATLVIYCGNWSCGKSLMGVKAAVKLGYKKVYRYQGGQGEWKEEGNALKPGLEP